MLPVLSATKQMLTLCMAAIFLMAFARFALKAEVATAAKSAGISAEPSKMLLSRCSPHFERNSEFLMMASPSVYFRDDWSAGAPG